jgi:hypothetical protein
MGKKRTGAFRTTITVPADLKRRMDAAGQDVNWSAVAARAFEAKLAEIAGKKVSKMMNDVIQRLRASKQRAEDSRYRDGEAAGRQWAKNKAEATELKKLERFRESLSHQWDEYFTEVWGANDFSPGEWLGMHITADDEGAVECADAEEFWRSVLGDRSYQEPVFAKGFAEGALTIWQEVKDKL